MEDKISYYYVLAINIHLEICYLIYIINEMFMIIG